MKKSTMKKAAQVVLTMFFSALIGILLALGL